MAATWSACSGATIVPETGVGHHSGFGKGTVLLHRGIVRVHLRLGVGVRDAPLEPGDHPERTAA
jgi:hypothetical protein